MKWFKKHTDTVTILGAVLGSILWMNGKFNDVSERFNNVNERFSQIENRLTRIETIIYIKGLVQHELALQEERK